MSSGLVPSNIHGARVNHSCSHLRSLPPVKCIKICHRLLPQLIFGQHEPLAKGDSRSVSKTIKMHVTILKREKNILSRLYPMSYRADQSQNFSFAKFCSEKRLNSHQCTYVNTNITISY